MANVINLHAESGANYIGDDSSPTLTFENTSSGEVLKLQNAGGTGVGLSVVSTPTTAAFFSGANVALEARAGVSAVNAAIFTKTTLSSPTIAVVKISASGASAPALEFAGTVVQSTASGTASLIAGIRVQFVDPAGLVRQGWIPVAVNIA